MSCKLQIACKKEWPGKGTEEGEKKKIIIIMKFFRYFSIIGYAHADSIAGQIKVKFFSSSPPLHSQTEAVCTSTSEAE